MSLRESVQLLSGAVTGDRLQDTLISLRENVAWNLVHNQDARLSVLRGLKAEMRSRIKTATTYVNQLVAVLSAKIVPKVEVDLSHLKNSLQGLVSTRTDMGVQAAQLVQAGINKSLTDLGGLTKEEIVSVMQECQTVIDMCFRDIGKLAISIPNYSDEMTAADAYLTTMRSIRSINLLSLAEQASAKGKHDEASNHLCAAYVGVQPTTEPSALGSKGNVAVTFTTDNSYVEIPVVCGSSSWVEAEIIFTPTVDDVVWDGVSGRPAPLVVPQSVTAVSITPSLDDLLEAGLFVFSDTALPKGGLWAPSLPNNGFTFIDGEGTYTRSAGDASFSPSSLETFFNRYFTGITTTVFNSPTRMEFVKKIDGPLTPTGSGHAWFGSRVSRSGHTTTRDDINAGWATRDVSLTALKMRFNKVKKVEVSEGDAADFFSIDTDDSPFYGLSYTFTSDTDLQVGDQVVPVTHGLPTPATITSKKLVRRYDTDGRTILSEETLYSIYATGLDGIDVRNTQLSIYSSHCDVFQQDNTKEIVSEGDKYTEGLPSVWWNTLYSQLEAADRSESSNVILDIQDALTLFSTWLDSQEAAVPRTDEIDNAIRELKAHGWTQALWFLITMDLESFFNTRLSQLSTSGKLASDLDSVINMVGDLNSSRG